MKVALIVVDTSGYKQKTVDQDGEVIRKALEEHQGELVFYKTIPEDEAVLSQVMKRIAERNVADLILTVGGTGLGPNDIAPNVVESIAQKNIPGMAEAVRIHLSRFDKHIMLSRMTGGVCAKTILFTLPRDSKLGKEALDFVYPEFILGMEMINNQVTTNDRI